MGMHELRSMYCVKLSVFFEPARAAGTSPVSWWCRAATLSGISWCTACAASRAASTPTMTGSSS